MKEATTLAFTGDIGFDHYMQNKWEDENLIDPAPITSSRTWKARWPAKMLSESKPPK